MGFMTSHFSLLSYVSVLQISQSKMNKLVCLIIFVVGLLSIVVGETKFEFPTEECASGFVTGNYIGCAAALANSIWKIHHWGADTTIDICGNECTGNLKGRLSHWKWKWDAKFQCLAKAPGIVGYSTALSRNGAMEHAINNWMIKASQAGSVDINDFKC